MNHFSLKAVFIMVTCVDHNQLDLFHKPARILIFGLSGAGKSYLVSKIVRKYHKKFDNIISIGSDLEKVDGLVQRDDSYDFENKDRNEKILLIFDDSLYRKSLMEKACKAFIHGRPFNISSIFISQTLFVNDNLFRIISLNVTHIILLTIRNIKSLKLYSKSFLPEESIDSFLSLYKHLVLDNIDHKHLLIDFSKPFPSVISFRSNIASEDGSYEETFTI